jgi:RHS repeat-associated protein
VVNRYDYLSWGEIRSQTVGVTNRFTFTGRELNPDNRTMHYRARTYLPHLGRFASEDRLGFVHGINVFRMQPIRHARLWTHTGSSAWSATRAPRRGHEAMVAFTRGRFIGGIEGPERRYP